MRPGESVIAIDGTGAWRRCIWRSAELLEPAFEVVSESAPAPKITVGFALLKGDKPEWVVQKLTELGVDCIVPMVTKHTVVRWDEEKVARNLERFRRVAYEAAMQSRRLMLPEVTSVTSVAHATSRGAALAHPGGSKVSLKLPFVIVGPEGGWSADELAGATSTVDLGPTVLRAETAATTIGGLLAAIRGNLMDLPHSVLARP